MLLPICLAGNTSYASDKKEGRFFFDQPDVNDDFQIHFNYLITLDGEDREWDINGKLEKLLTELNEVMYKETKANKFSNGVGKRYKYDRRTDGKLDITFIRLDKYRNELSQSPNNDISKLVQLGWEAKYSIEKGLMDIQLIGDTAVAGFLVDFIEADGCNNLFQVSVDCEGSPISFTYPMN